MPSIVKTTPVGDRRGRHIATTVKKGSVGRSDHRCRGGCGGDGDHHRRPVLDAADHPAASGGPGQCGEQDRRRAQVQADPVGQVRRERATEDQSGEGGGEHHLDHADHQSCGQRRERPLDRPSSGGGDLSTR